MPNYAVYNPASTPVSNLITKVLRSYPEDREAAIVGTWVKNPPLAAGLDQALPMRWTGTQIVNLSAAEQTSVANAAAAAKLAMIRAATFAIFTTGTSEARSAEGHGIRIACDTLLDQLLGEINTLRTAGGLAARNITTYKTNFRTTCETKANAIVA